MKEELKKFEISPEAASMMEVLGTNYPKYTKISELVVEGCTLEETILQIRDLLERAVIMTKDVLNLISN